VVPLISGTACAIPAIMATEISKTGRTLHHYLVTLYTLLHLRLPCLCYYHRMLFLILCGIFNLQAYANATISSRGIIFSMF
jgi:Fe2+ transport system protein B